MIIFVFLYLLIVWQEVFDNGIRLDRNNSIIQVWKDWGTKWEEELRKVSLIHFD